MQQRGRDVGRQIVIARSNCRRIMCNRCQRPNAASRRCTDRRRTPPSRDALRHSGGWRRLWTSATVTLYLDVELSNDRRPGTEQNTSACCGDVMLPGNCIFLLPTCSFRPWPAVYRQSITCVYPFVIFTNSSQLLPLLAVQLIRAGQRS